MEQLTNQELKEPSNIPRRPFARFIVYIIGVSGILSLFISLLGLIYLVFIISKLNVSNDIVRSYYNAPELLLTHYSVPITILASSLLAACIGYLLIRIAFRSTKRVIPDEDRSLLETIIKDEKDYPIKRYIKLSSLTGSIGIFTKIGLTGLPLATISLTLIFAFLSFFEHGSQNFIDFTKLTLGAFIGSYVQRNVGQNGDVGNKKEDDK